MSEVEPNRPPQFPRHLPQAVANDEVNRIIRTAIREAIEEENGNEYATAEEHNEAVARDFYADMGSGVIVSEVQERIEALSDRYVAHTSVYDTALQWNGVCGLAAQYR